MLTSARWCAVISTISRGGWWTREWRFAEIGKLQAIRWGQTPVDRLLGMARLLLEYGVAASTVAVGWSGYTVSLLHDLGINLPAALTAAPGTTVTDPVTGAAVMGIMNLPALLGIVAVTALLTVGVSESATVNNVVVAIKVTVVIAFIVIGAPGILIALIVLLTIKEPPRGFSDPPDIERASRARS